MKTLRLFVLGWLACAFAGAQVQETGINALPPAPIFTVIATAWIRGGTCQGIVNAPMTGGNAGDLVVCEVNGAESPATVTDGAQNLTALAANGSGSFQNRLYYALSATGANETYSADFGCGGPANLYCVDVKQPSGTWHFETSNQNSSASGTAVDSGSISTTHTNEFILFAPWINWGGGACPGASNFEIGGRTSTALPWSPINWTGFAGCTSGSAFQFGGYLPTNANFSGDGTLQLGGSQPWAANIGAWYAQ